MRQKEKHLIHLIRQRIIARVPMSTTLYNKILEGEYLTKEQLDSFVENQTKEFERANQDDLEEIYYIENGDVDRHGRWSAKKIQKELDLVKNNS